jgi:hypothetical protein
VVVNPLVNPARKKQIVAECVEVDMTFNPLMMSTLSGFVGTGRDESERPIIRSGRRGLGYITAKPEHGRIGASLIRGIGQLEGMRREARHGEEY